MKRTLLYLLVISCMISCNIYFKTVDEVSEEIASFDLDKFNLFTFQLVKKKDDSVAHPVYANGLNKEEDDLVYEELYLFLEEKGNTALYLTTFSHKYIFDDGVFNKPFNKHKIAINEIDLIFVGSYDKEKITFKKPKNEDVDAMELYYTKLGDNIKLEKITNNYGDRSDRESTPYVKIDTVFSVAMMYQKDLRSFVYQIKEDDKIKEEINVKSLAINTKDLYFGLVRNKDKYIYLKDRIGNEFTN